MKKQRQVEESREDLPTVKNDAPESKFQKDQQVAPSTGFNSGTGSSKFTLEKKKAPGSQLKQEVASSVVRDANLVGGSAGDGGSFAGLRSSGSVGGVAGVGNATPNVGKPSRSDSRTGKKLDRNSTKLNYIPSDQVLTEWDESKPLADAADADQGFNGTYRNEFARSQKKAENVPGALMFERSLDLMIKDKIYFGQGQYIKQTGAALDNELTKIPTLNAMGVYVKATSDNYEGGRYGNYLATNLHYQFDANGKLIYFYFDERDLTPTVDEHVANKSSLAAKIATNRGELWRETMDSKAGDEKADIWSPLPRAVQQPTATVTLLEAIEADTGNEIMVAYRKSLTCSSYQLNVAHKDGQKEVAPGIYASAGLQHNYTSSEYAEQELPDINHLFDRDAVCKGLPTTMIAIYDSPRKYQTKADFIIQPRSYRMHLQTADNNMDPLYADKSFVSIYDASETFSTIDREYDPNSPVFMTDKAAVIHRVSWNKQAAFMRQGITNYFSARHDGDAALASDFTIVNAGIMGAAKLFGLNCYVIFPTELAGALTFADGVVKKSGAADYDFDGGKTARVVFGTTAPTPGSGMTLLTITNSNLPQGALILQGTFKNYDHSMSASSSQYYKLDGYARYMYSDLRNNYVVDVEHPLLAGLIEYLQNGIGAKYYEVSGGRDINVPVVHSTQFFSLWSLLLCAAVPFIIKKRINSYRDVLYYEKNVEYPFKDALVPMSEVKTKAYANFGFTDKDSELEVKRMLPTAALTWILPELLQQVGYDSAISNPRKVLMPWYTNQNELSVRTETIDGVETTIADFNDDASAMSMPSIRSGVRFAALDSFYSMTEKDIRLTFDMIASFKDLNPDVANSYAYKYSAVGDGQMVLALDTHGITAAEWMTLPRQLGWVMDAPYGVLTPKYNDEYGLDDDIIGTSSYRAQYWLAKGAVSHDCGQAGQDILAATAINIGRAANFQQEWFAVLASGTTPTHDHGFALSLNQLLSSTGTAHFGDTYFKPFTTLENEGTPVTSKVNGLLSFQKVFWTRIQKLPFIVSPFDCKVIDNTGSPNNVLVADPYDMMYFFGLGGFRASDFRESVYNREKEIVNQGYLFVSDPWVLASPLLKEGAGSAGVSMTKGFEL